MHLRVALFCFVSLLANIGYANVVYVDSGTGLDSDSGALESPWRTIQHGVNQLGAGDTLVVRPGTYFESVNVSVAGTDEAPIEISCESGAVLSSPDPAASLSAFNLAESAHNVSLSGCEARDGYHEAIFVRPGATKITIRSCDLHGNRAGIWISGASDIEVDACTIHGNSSSGVRVAGDSTEITIRDTTSYENDDGQGCSGDADGFTVEQSASRVHFIGCTASANSEDGFDIQGDEVSVSSTRSTSNGCAGVKLARSATIVNSVIAGNITGVIATAASEGAQEISLLNTIVADNTGTQILFRNPTPPTGEGSSYSATLRNVVAAGPGKALEVEAGILLTENHNIFFRPNTTEGLIVVHGPSDGPLRYSGQQINSGEWSAASSQGLNTWAIDPGFANSGDYQSSALSPAIDSGTNPGDLGEDIQGNSRPSGGAFDRGAYESDLLIDNQMPWPDPGPQRDVLVGGRITMQAYGSLDPDGDALEYTWHFDDDGEVLQGYAVQHEFNVLGDHLVRLSVSDGSVEVTRNTLVSVLEEWPTPTAEPTATPTATATATEYPATSSPTATITATEPPATPTATSTTSATYTPTATPTTEIGRCPLQPKAGCLLPSASACKAKDRKPSGPSDKDRLVWKWIGGPTMTPRDFGEPEVGSTEYSLCVYDDIGLQTEMGVATSESCTHESCWRSNKKGFRFRDGNLEGVQLLKLKAGGNKSKIVLVARGPLSFLDRSTPLTVQLIRADTDNPCWETWVEAVPD